MRSSAALWAGSLFLSSLSWPLLALGAPKVCGNQTALGNFDAAKCPELLDDGVPPDEVKGDGIYTLGVKLEPLPKPTDVLQYKILTSGEYAPNGVEITGACGPAGGPANNSNNIIVPYPDLSATTVFYYDSRNLTDPSYAPVSGGHSAGDNIMLTAPMGGSTGWVAVGEFQAKGFDPVAGVVDLVPGADKTVLTGEVVAPRDLPAGWQWKVLEKKGTYDGARKFGSNGAADDGAGHDGWSYTPCDSHNVHVGSAVAAGSTIRFVFYSRYGRLQTVLPMQAGGDMAVSTSPDLSTVPGVDAAGGEGGTGDLTLSPNLPGIHCNCRVGGGGQVGTDGVAGAMLLLLCALWPGIRHARLVRHVGRTKRPGGGGDRDAAIDGQGAGNLLSL